MAKLISRIAVTLIVIGIVTSLGFFAGHLLLVVSIQGGSLDVSNITTTLFLAPFIGLGGIVVSLCLGFPLAALCRKLKRSNRWIIPGIGGVLGAALGVFFAGGGMDISGIAAIAIFAAIGVLNAVVAKAVWQRSEKIKGLNLSTLH